MPSADLVTALREQKLLTVGAGENVVRFLPPLIVTEAEIEESVRGSSAPASALSGASVETGGGAMSKALRHFLDLNELPTKELRNMLAASVAMKAKLKAQKTGRRPTGRSKARRWR